VKIFNTNHAFCLETENGAEIVVHMGIDTVALNGQGFKRLVEEGAEVKRVSRFWKWIWTS
jgi:PTS system N-acetylglucosamine-specific IIC component